MNLFIPFYFCMYTMYIQNYTIIQYVNIYYSFMKKTTEYQLIKT